MDIDSLIDDVECQADEWGMQTVSQIHGHRNKSGVTADAHQHVWNLEHNVERGGTIRVVVIDREGHVHVEEYPARRLTRTPRHTIGLPPRSRQLSVRGPLVR